MYLVRFQIGLVVAAMLMGADLLKLPWLKRSRFPLLLLIHFTLGLWLIGISPQPFIDVFYWHKEALQALLNGYSPYSITIPDIYPPDLSSLLYGPGISAQGRITVGFPYPPLSLILDLPGHWLGNDFRYSHLAAMTLSGAFIGYSRPGWVAKAAAGLFLFSPRTFYVLEQGWTEPLVVLMFCVVVFCACRAIRFLPWVLGGFLGVKQYSPLSIPLFFLLLSPPRTWSRFFWLAAGSIGVSIAITLPLLLWDLPGFLNSVILFQFRQPFRSDSLSYLVLYQQWFPSFSKPSTIWGFLALLVAEGISLWRGPRNPAGFAGTIAFSYLAFFAFNKQAFCNYYYFVIGCLCASLGALEWKNQKPRPGP